MVKVNEDDIEMQQGPSVAPIKLERKEDKGMYEITNKGIFMIETIKGRGYYLFMTVWACAKLMCPFFQPLFFQNNPVFFLIKTVSSKSILFKIQKSISLPYPILL